MLRESGGGMHGVRAIAIDLGAGRVQISTNVHDPRATPLGEVVASVHRLAFPVGGRAVAAELIGLVPEAALVGYPGRGPDPLLRPAQADDRGASARAQLRGRPVARRVIYASAHARQHQAPQAQAPRHPDRQHRPAWARQAA